MKRPPTIIDTVYGVEITEIDVLITALAFASMSGLSAQDLEAIASMPEVETIEDFEEAVNASFRLNEIAAGESA